jgi:hypothetical protein
MSVTQDELNAELQRVTALISNFGTMLGAWTAGVAGGGPAGDGKYPLPTGLGTTVAVSCPAQIAVDSTKLVLAGPNGGIQLGVTPGFTASGSSYTFKESDGGKIFMLLGNTATTAMTVFLPDNLPPGWAVLIVQLGDGRITARKVGDTNPVTNSNLRNRQGFFTTAGKGSPMTIICDTRSSSNNNAVYTVAGDLAA